MLVEGWSIRSTVRTTGVAENTVSKLLLEPGACCVKFQNETMRDLNCKRIHADEIWSFLGCKKNNVTVEEVERDGIVGSVWT